MNVYLLDVNVLVALLWPAHQSHLAVQRWFAGRARLGWATCPFTQAGFVRIVSNPAFSRDAVNPQEAVRVLQANTEHRSHRFLGGTLRYGEAVEPFGERLAGHQQVTDAYLLGLAIRNDGRLATLDRSVAALAGPSERRRVELIPSP